MTLREAKMLAKELSDRYGRTVYVHIDPATEYNLRFDEPIESVDSPTLCRTVEGYSNKELLSLGIRDRKGVQS